jgi:fatty acid desaturase
MLKYKHDRRTLAFVAGYFALFLFQWIVAPGPWPVTVGLILLTCWLSWVCAVITHNTIHHPIFHDKRLNKAFQVVLTLTYGHPVSAFVPGHNLSHHRFTQQAKDVMRTSKVRYRWNLLNGLLFMPKVAGNITLGDVKFFRKMRKEKPRWARQFTIEAVIFFGLSAVLLVVDWQKFLMYWFAPHFFAAWGIISINFLQHDGCDEDHPYNHSRNFVGRVFNWFHFNNGFHGIHHMHPGLHWSKLPEAHARELAPHIHPALDQPSILVCIWRTFVWPGRRLRYDGAPLVLPPPMEDESWFSDGVAGTSLGVET